MKELFVTMIEYSVLIPTAVLCFLPVIDYLKVSPRRIFFYGILLFSIVIPVFSICAIRYPGFTTNGFPICMIGFFLIYLHFINGKLGPSLAVFLFVMALMSFASDFAIIVDARFHPQETNLDVCLLCPCIQLLFTILLALIFGIILYRYGRRLFHILPDSKIWYLVLPIPLFFLFVNYMVQPHVYETLYVGRVFLFYVSYLSASFILFAFLGIVFYWLVTELSEKAKISKQVQLFELQEQQYEAQQHYLIETSRIRHDFRQSIHALQELAALGAYDELSNYLNEFSSQLPENTICLYCKNTAINAVLNYYEYQAKDACIRMTWEIAFPEIIPQTLEVDLCNLFGNILENVYYGCLTLPENQRYHNLTITLKNQRILCIVSVNSFDGNAQEVVSDTQQIPLQRHYVSTRKNGSGIGLSSIAMTAEKYHGQARFSHTKNEFNIDVMLELPDDCV